MMWKEFEELAGYEVSYEDYTNVIEPMYMALPEKYTKQDFVKMIDKKRFALKTKKQIENEMKKIAQYIFDNCGLKSYIDEDDKLNKLAREYATRFYGYTNEDMKSWFYINRDYAYCGVRQERGCTFPEELVIGRDYTEYTRLALVRG